MALLLAQTILNTGIRKALRCTASSYLLKYEVSAKLFLPKIQTRTYGEEKGYGEKPHCNVGTIGHIEHGKTTLTAAIMKVLSEKKLSTSKEYNEIDKAPQVKLDGIKMQVARVQYDTENRHYGHTDCPENSDYIKIMITGTAQMDGAILVVAATDGAMPQTREHLILSKKIGIEHIVVFINKIDAVDSEMVKLVEIEIRELLSEIGFNSDKVPVIKGSALCALEGKRNEIGSNSIMKLLSAVDRFIPTPVRDLDKPFFMPVDGAYPISGGGTFVIGALERGIIKKGMQCEFVGINKTFTSVITNIEMFHQTSTEAHAGDQLGANIKGVEKDEVKRGMIMCKPGTTKTHDHIEALIYILKHEEGGKNNPVFNFVKLQMFSKTWDCSVRVFIPEKNLAMPGEGVTIQLKMFSPMVLEKGQHFTLRDGSITLGTGVVSNVFKNLNERERLRLMEGKRKNQREAPKRPESKNSQDFWSNIVAEKKFWLDVLAAIATALVGFYYLKMALYNFIYKNPLEIVLLDLSIEKTQKEMEDKKIENEKQIKDSDLLTLLIQKLVKAIDLYIDLNEKK